MADSEEEKSADYTGINILVFVIITILYYAFAKPKFTLDLLKDPDSLADAARNQKYMSGIYFLLVIFFQFIMNSNAMVNRCGGSVSSNMATAAWMTAVPWIFIFGIMMLMVMTFPGMKTAFSDVIGYFAISYSANTLLAELLKDSEVDASLSSADVDDKTKQAYQSAAQAIIKLMGNVSVLVNQVVPSTFMKFWQTLTPLMKPKYSDFPDSGETMAKKEAFLNLVTFRDNVGEACWYLYTGIFLIMVINNNIVTHKCDTDPRLMNAKYDEYMEKKRKEKEAQEKQAVDYKL